MTWTLDRETTEHDYIDENGRRVFPQMYVFTMPSDSICSVWCEGFDELGHYAAPTPFETVAVALAALQALHPTYYIDELEIGSSDHRDAIEFAHTLPALNA